MNRCYLSLGSNLRTPERQLRMALKKLRNTPGIQVTKLASFYKNQAVGRRSQPAFCNTTVELFTNRSPLTVLRLCLALEAKQGRYRRVKWGARTLDIDILFYNQLKISRHNLTIPHPLIAEREFVIIPLREIMDQKLSCLPDTVGANSSINFFYRTNYVDRKVSDGYPQFPHPTN